MPDGPEVGTAYVSIVPSGKDFGSKLTQQVTGAAGPAGEAGGKVAGRGIASGISSTGATIAKSITGTFAVIGAARFFSGAIGEAREAAEVGRQTEAVIASMGGASKVTVGHVSDLAEKLSTLVGVDDDVIQGGQNLLLTFGNIRNEVGKGNDIFDQASLAMLNLSARFHQDVETSAVQLGKALNDPIAGVTALRKVGVQLTDQQEEQVKAFVKSGDVMSAQKVILAELTAQTDKAAEAAADPADKAAVAWGNLQEDLGTALLPVLLELARVFSEDIAPALTTIVDLFGQLPGPVQTSLVGLTGITLLAGPMTRFAHSLGLVAKGVGLIGKAMLANPWILAIALAIIGLVLIVKNWDKIKAFLGRAWEWIRDKAAEVWGAITEFLSNAWTWIKEKALEIWGQILDFIRSIPGRILEFLSSLPGMLWGLFTDAFHNVLNIVIDIGGRIVGFMAELPGRLLGALGDFGTLLLDAGSDLLHGLWDGIAGALGWLYDQIKGLAGGIVDTFKSALGIDSPSKVFTELGGELPAGLAVGIRRGSGLAQRATDEMLTFHTVPSTFTAPSTTGHAVGALTPQQQARDININLNGPISIRDDRDIRQLAIELKREENRQLRGYGRTASPLP